MIKKLFSRFKKNFTNNLKKIKNSYETKIKPRSKRKDLFLGFTTVLGIFGLTLLAPVLKAIAQDVPNNLNNEANIKLVIL